MTQDTIELNNQIKEANNMFQIIGQIEDLQLKTHSEDHEQHEDSEKISNVNFRIRSNDISILARIEHTNRIALNQLGECFYDITHDYYIFAQGYLLLEQGKNIFIVTKFLPGDSIQGLDPENAYEDRIGY